MKISLARVLCVFVLGLSLFNSPLLLAEEAPRRERVLTKAEQAALTPEQVLTILRKGNERFVAGDVTSRDHSKMVRDAVPGQYPKAVVLSCLDSRIPVEDVFDRGIGDIFVARVAGNFVNTDILGSMEFGCAVAGAKLVVVMGHGSCGAVVGAINKVELGNLTATLANIRPAVDASSDFPGSKDGNNSAYVDRVTEENVRLNVAAIRQRSPLLRQLEEEGKLKIVGGIYEMSTGRVVFIP
jgi:carbonic anhydrase